MSFTLPGWLRHRLGADGDSISDVPKKSLLSPENQHLARELSDELWRQRVEAEKSGEEYRLSLNSEGAEGIEKILWALAEGDFNFASIRAQQLINGLMAELDQEWVDP